MPDDAARRFGDGLLGVVLIGQQQSFMMIAGALAQVAIDRAAAEQRQLEAVQAANDAEARWRLQHRIHDERTEGK